MSQFLNDVLRGLSSKNKYLESKYFYDKKGDVLFQKIMGSKEYYPTKCEMEIFTAKKEELVKAITAKSKEFDIVELGAGDATKSMHLLQQLVDDGFNFNYYPIDISNNVISFLESTLPAKIPGLEVKGLNGEYFKMLDKAKGLSGKTKVVLFLGGNIGNVTLEKAEQFCKELRSHLLPGDLVVVGFDLKKDPKTILDAYNDSAGYTKEFNLNLLSRINEELKGDFNLNNFYHYPIYDPSNGATKSFIVSKEDQQVNIADSSFRFKKGEHIFMEISQKYTINQTDQLAVAAGFESLHHIQDSKEWFLDAVWRAA